ncbi:plant virulence effector HPE1-like domain-containing protein [Pseudohoeflea coraliihabitans]|uniref:Uncharacterized protein n=1 Tax=Pseudohoeflea coraliihabitans TaxID=2860393 RepID=A0ABS6WLX4_9HYPH|nr:plant virulence effector HPE1-like domain-containing protein [Pseudohoeflea sp. DP4N28-3]MBW3096964.1 hypothetical protein [Pseudohoeflea sp. DP4N28-3]
MRSILFAAMMSVPAVPALMAVTALPAVAGSIEVLEVSAKTGSVITIGCPICKAQREAEARAEKMLPPGTVLNELRQIGEETYLATTENLLGGSPVTILRKARPEEISLYGADSVDSDPKAPSLSPAPLSPAPLSLAAVALPVLPKAPPPELQMAAPGEMPLRPVTASTLPVPALIPAEAEADAELEISAPVPVIDTTTTSALERSAEGDATAPIFDPSSYKLRVN